MGVFQLPRINESHMQAPDIKVTIIAPLKVERLLPGSRCDRAWKNMSVQEKLLWYKYAPYIVAGYG